MVLKEIEKSLLKKLGWRQLRHNEAAAAYLNTKLKVLGVPVPLQREVAKNGFTFSDRRIDEQIELWEDVFHKAEYHEIKSQALLFVERNFKKLDKELLWKSMKGWIASTDNWAHSDGLSSYYSKILEAREDLVFPVLKKWNASKNLWERRQSLVSLMYYQRTKQKFVPVKEMKILIENLLGDKEYYVQKGLGWTLREMRQVYKKETDKFIEGNLGRISPIAFTCSIEHMQTSEKLRLKQRRKQIRSGIV
jgi:3-methyladenine DNA glycosylase AlkD